MPQWQDILQKNKKLFEIYTNENKKGPNVLIPTSVGGQAAVTILEGLLGVALTLRGANVHFLLCDRLLPVCLNSHIKKIGEDLSNAEKIHGDKICFGCSVKGKATLESTGVPVLYYSQFINDDVIQEINSLATSIGLVDLQNYTTNNVNIGEHAKAGALRFFARGSLERDDASEQILRRYFKSALMTEQVMQNIYDEMMIDVAVFNHGIYVPHGIIGDVSRSRDIRVANWQVAYRQKCFIFSHKETYHHALISEPKSNWENISWNEKIEKETMDYLKSRWYGTKDWIWFHDQPDHNIHSIVEQTKLDLNRPIVTILTNVFWDAQLHYKANAFNDMLEWINYSIEYFKNRKDLQIVIRIHPAEVRGAIPSRQPFVEEIKKAHPDLADNIIIIPPESSMSTYTLCEHSNAVIIYGTKTGVETTAMGIPVIVAGEAWIRNKGLTYDAENPEQYRSILDQLPFENRLSVEATLLAKKYAFHFFFRRFIPLSFMEPCQSGVPYEVKIESLEELLPGKDKGLDVLCDGIMNGSEFIFPAEDYI
jgi:hypothetical protein